MLTVIIATLVVFALGFLWYSPVLFGDVWMKEMKIDAKKAKEGAKEMWKPAIIQFLVSWMIVYAMAWILPQLGVDSVGSLLMVVFVLRAAFNGGPGLSGILREGKSLKLFGINAGYYLVAIFVAGYIVM